MLVSAETVNDFQLNPGDLIRLRLQDARTARLPDRCRSTTSGIVNEFPTAPKDSFLVANAAYVAQQTGSDAVGTFLVDTGGHQRRRRSPTAVRAVVGTTGQRRAPSTTPAGSSGPA